MCIAELRPGAEASRHMTASREKIAALAEITGDYNPIHFSDEAARAAGFRGVIAHALFCEGLISAVIANDLPGPGSIILSQEIRCLKPVYLGETVTARVRVRQVEAERGLVEVEIQCGSQSAASVLEGSARLLLRG